VSSNQDSVQNHDQICDARKLAEGLLEIIEHLDAWVLAYQPHTQKHQIGRSDLQLRTAQVERIHEALQWDASVGFYGESQAGKSNLVSRLARSLASVESEDGGLCIRGIGNESIDFMDQIDPGGSGKESTGVVCRFTTRNIYSDTQVPEGSFPVTFISHAELICSLVDGFQSGVDQEVRPDRTSVRQTLEKLRKAPRERDGVGPNNNQNERPLMPQLLEVWSVLSTNYENELIRELDVAGEGDSGWDEFVRECVDRGERPTVGTSDESDFRRLVSMLWGGDHQMGALWFRLFKDLRKLQQMTHHYVESKDVCKGQGGGGQSLIDIHWLNDFAGDTHEPCNVGGWEGGRQTHQKLSKASFVALARGLVLPVKVDGANHGCFDVIDFPGARAPDKQKDLQGNDEAARTHAVQALRRGKLNRLFVTGTAHFDSSVLCLVTQSGNQSAGGVIRKALKVWLERERWFKSEAHRRSPSARPRNAIDGCKGPPMVVAMTKVDLQARQPSRLEDILKEVRETISPNDFPWMDNWSDSGGFQGIHWVYNPKASVGITPIKPLYSQGVKDQFLKAFDDSELLRRYSKNLKANLDALFAPDGDPAVTLTHELQELVKSAGHRRVPQLALNLLAQASELKGRMKQIFMGDVDPREADHASELAKKHMEAILALDVTHAAGLLRCLTMSTRDVRIAWQRALEMTNSGLDLTRGAVSFDVFFLALSKRFDDEFQRRSEQTHMLWKTEMERRHKAAFVTEFKHRVLMLPKAPWFKRPLRERVEPLLRQVNAAQMSRERLATIVAAQWNRSMTWLGKEPPVGGDGYPNRPKLRGEEASNRSIVQHWSSALSKAYKDLVDPEDRRAPWNVKVGEHLRELDGVLGVFRDAVKKQKGEHWEEVKSELDTLLADALTTGNKR